MLKTILTALLFALAVSGCAETQSNDIDASANCPNHDCNGLNGFHFIGGAPGY